MTKTLSERVYETFASLDREGFDCEDCKPLSDEVAALEDIASKEIIRRGDCEAALEVLEQRLEGLEPYAVHKGYCITRIKGGGHYQTMASCDCGLKEALAEEEAT